MKSFNTLILLSALFYGSGVNAQDQICGDIGLGQINFQKGSSKLTNEGRQALDALTATLGGSDVTFTAFSADLCDKESLLAWDRISAISAYLVKKGFKGKIAGQCKLDDNRNYVDWMVGWVAKNIPGPLLLNSQFAL